MTLNATAKFYIGLAIVTLLVVGLSFWAGYRSGYGAGAAAAPAAHRRPAR